MTVDSSAILAILLEEDEGRRLAHVIATASRRIIGAPTVAEAQLALSAKLRYDASALVEQFLIEANIQVLPFTRDHISAFMDAYLRFGRGRHPARLNMGDCFSYAVAKVANTSLLFVGNDFSQTDIPAEPWRSNS